MWKKKVISYFPKLQLPEGAIYKENQKNQIRRPGITDEFFLLRHTSYIEFNP